MKTFYKIVDGKAKIGSGTVIPNGFIEYTIDQEPQELIDGLAYKTPVEMVDAKWKIVDEYMATLEVTSEISLGGNKFNVSPQGIINIQNKMRTMISTDSKYWVESWASFYTNIVEMEWVLKETERLRDAKIIEVGL